MDFKKDVYISPNSLSRLLGRTVFTLVLMHIVLQVVHYYFHELPWLLREIFDVDEEESFANWFSAMILFVSCLLIFLIANQKKRNKESFTKHWYGLAWGFGLMSIDEVAGLHETFNTLTDFAWTIPGAILVLFLFLFYLKFLLALPQPIRFLILMAGGAFVGGSVVIEHLADYYVEAYKMDNFGYQVLTAIEETLEMSGIIIFIHALLKYLNDYLLKGEPIVFHLAGKNNP